MLSKYKSMVDNLKKPSTIKTTKRRQFYYEKRFEERMHL